jgi:hypothetical protein
MFYYEKIGEVVSGKSETPNQNLQYGNQSGCIGLGVVNQKRLLLQGVILCSIFIINLFVTLQKK